MQGYRNNKVAGNGDRQHGTNSSFGGESIEMNELHNSSIGSDDILDDDLDQFEIDVEEGTTNKYSTMSNGTLLTRLLHKLSRILDGPVIPKEDRHFNFGLTSKLARIDEIPSRFNKKYSKNKRFIWLLLYFNIWGAMLYFALIDHLTKEPKYLHGNNDESSEIITLSCRDSNLFWQGKNSQCGLNGKNCMPFDSREILFRCPALCDMDSMTYSDLPVGDQVIKYRNYYIGGGKLESKASETDILSSGQKVKYLSKPYRSDSFPCGAAVHAGIVSPLYGGYARVLFTGEQMSFASEVGASMSNAMESIEFESAFPSSYRFIEYIEDKGYYFNCYDTRAKVFFINYIMGLPLFFIDLHSIVSFVTMSIIGFWSIVLSFDPPIIVNVLNPDSLPSLISKGFERFLPFIFIVYTIWKLVICHSIGFPNSAIMKVVLWYNCYWLGILNNVTFDRLPVDRLTLEDIKTQPGSILATIMIISFILICSLIQGYKLWEFGKFKKNLVIYLSIISGIFIINNLPHLNLRIHHYILAMILIIGTKTKGMTAMIFQGLLFGLLVNGIARWGFASILETNSSLRRGDPSGDIKPPHFVGFNSTTLELSWDSEEDRKQMEKVNYLNGDVITPSNKLKGYSLLLNDIEVYNGVENKLNLQDLITENQELSYLKEYLADEEKEIKKLYLRVARSELNDLSGRGKRSDYTRAGVVEVHGDKYVFHQPQKGLT